MPRSGWPVAMALETADAKPRSPVSVAITMRGHTLIQDKLPQNGGKDEGPMASEFLLASLLACQHSTFVKVAAKRRVEAQVDSLHGEMDFDAAGDISRIEVRFRLRTKAPADAVATVLRLTESTCTISRALKLPVGVAYDAV